MCGQARSPFQLGSCAVDRALPLGNRLRRGRSLHRGRRDSLSSVLCLALIGLLAERAYAAPLTPENSDWNVNRVAVSGTFDPKTDPQKYKGRWPSHSYMPSPDDWREIMVFQLLTDRFYDADPTNNELEFEGFDLRDHSMRHGGDFRGIMKKLDYIRGLGFRAIWISPVFQNEFNSYHGYAQTDFTMLDKRWGTLDDFRKLVDAAHARGMYVIVDIVVNHMANRHAFVNKSTGEPELQESMPFGLHQKEYELRRRPEQLPYADFDFSNDWDSTGLYPYRDNKSFPYYGWDGKACSDDGSHGQGGYWNSDFHHNGDLINYADTFNNHLGKIYGIMDDLRTESPTVRDKMIAMSAALIHSVDIDGFRLDTPMQVELDFFKTWIPAVRAAAKDVGKHNFGFWGEFFITPERMGTFVGRGRAGDSQGPASSAADPWLDGRRAFDGGIDYMYGIWGLSILNFEQLEAASKEMIDFGTVKGVHKIWKYQSTRWDFYNDATSANSYVQWTFCNNHDRERMSQYNCGKEKTDMCHAIFIFWPGQYVFYVGDEQHYSNPGTALNGWAREELTTSLAWRQISAEHNGDDFDMASEPYLRVAHMTALRTKFWPALKCEHLKLLHSPDDDKFGILAWERSCLGESPIRLLVVVNAAADTNKLHFHAKKLGWQVGDKVKDVIGMLTPDSSTEYVINENRYLEISMPRWAYAVFVKADVDSAIPPVVTSISPAHDAAVLADEPLKVSISFSEDMEADSVAENAYIRDANTRSPKIARTKLECINKKPDGTGREFTFQIPESAPSLTAGIFIVDVSAARSKSGTSMVSTFHSRFRVNATERSLLITPDDVVDLRLIKIHPKEQATPDTCTLRHRAAGAELFRVRNALFGKAGEWSSWEKYKDETGWNCTLRVPVIVQYYIDGSAAYFKGDCKSNAAASCMVSWYPSMYWHGEDTVEDPPRWEPYAMRLVDNFVWEVEVETWKPPTGSKRKAEYKFNPAGDWSAGAYGIDPTVIDGFGKETGLKSVQDWMILRGRWRNGVGKVQHAGDSISYTDICPPRDDSIPGGRATKCTFRLSDFHLTFSQCPETGLCWMPGTPIRQKDFKVHGDVCDPTADEPERAAGFNSAVLVWIAGIFMAVVLIVLSVVSMRRRKMGGPQVMQYRSQATTGLTSRTSQSPMRDPLRISEGSHETGLPSMRKSDATESSGVELGTSSIKGGSNGNANAEYANAA